MNIFFLSLDTEEAAMWHCDAHVVKMILESAQLLFTAHHVTNPDIFKQELPFKVYKPTHKNHPCAKWARESLSHYTWLCSLAWCLCLEYTHRYSITTPKTHASQPAIEWLCHNPPPLPNLPFVQPPQAMGKNPECMGDDSVVAYRKLYRDVKAKTMPKFRYTKREPPTWLIK